MSDPTNGPNDPLRHLQQLGLDVHPLPASEVRRRGDRMRRRNTAVAVVGGIAAVVLVAVPLSLAAGGSNHSAPGPVDTPTPTPPVARADWLQQVPESFDLAQGLSGGGAGTTGPGSGPALPTEVCGAPAAWSGDRVVAGTAAQYLGESEDRRWRVLSLYPDDRAATLALDAMRAGIMACPGEPTNRGPREQRFELRDYDAGDQSFDYVQRTYDLPGNQFIGDLTVYEVVRVGNALYAASYYGQGGADENVISYTRQLVHRDSAPVISDMCVFAAEPCRTPSSGDTPSGSVTIPADFPILDGYPEDSRAESDSYGRWGPDSGQPPTRLGACGTRSPAPEATATLTGGWTNPEDFRTRQLVTFATPEAAAAWVQSPTGLWADCPEEQTGDGSTTVRSVHEGEEYADQGC